MGLNGLLLILYTTFAVSTAAVSYGYSNIFLLIVLLVSGLLSIIVCPVVLSVGPVVLMALGSVGSSSLGYNQRRRPSCR